jgi:transcriptional regulator GlxA family with amidase domain
MNELSNDVIDLDLISSRFSTLHARLLETASRHERFAQLEALVRERVATQVRVRPFIRWATAQIERTHGAVRILDLCRDLGVSRKHLNQWFHSQVGLAPKQYAGVARFQRLIACLTRAPAPEWSDLAQNCGFYDQAHLVHDCHAFAGMAPGALRESLSPDGTAAIEGNR